MPIICSIALKLLGEKPKYVSSICCSSWLPPGSSIPRRITCMPSL